MLASISVGAAMTLGLWVVAYGLAIFVYSLSVVLIAKLLISRLLKRWNTPNWLSLLLASTLFGLVLGILSVSFSSGSFRYFINPYGMNLTNAITNSRSSDYFWVTLELYTGFGIVLGTTLVYRFHRSSDFWSR
jgi:NADH:ubiquinone oxidoreductase subunit 6 (subunit J)